MTNPSINVEGVPQNIGEFLQDFYSISDDPKATLEEYSNNFHFDEKTIFRIGPMQSVKDEQSVQRWRSKAWDLVQQRKHTVHGVFSKPNKSQIDSNSPECMLYGRVEYTMKDGKTSGADWGGHVIFHPSSFAQGGKPKMSSYNVWITPDQVPKI